jgi:hypothetical protein
LDSQVKRDLVAAGAILLMFLGAFILPTTSLGLVSIGMGAFVIILLSASALSTKQ